MSTSPSLARQLLSVNVIVSALGYFVDIYDLVLFSIVRVASLKGIGVPDDQLLDVGVRLINLQMGGMLLGGILWGVLGDKRGRLSVLFGSIALYSTANILNAFVTTPEMYGLLRFVAGVGLAGELGAAVTLVSETLPRETRGYGTALVAGIGVSGAALAAFVGAHYTWQTAFIVGGVLGFVLLALRVRMFESGLYADIKQRSAVLGRFSMLFTSKERFCKYLNCILIGVPIWFVISILVTFSPELTKELGATAPVSAGSAILWCYTGLIVGDLGSGVLSQFMKSRKKVVFLFLSAALALILLFLYSYGRDPSYYYLVCFALGCAVGYWALFVTIAAEQFGTNLRATAATTVPNFVRGSVVLVTLLFQAMKPALGLVQSALVVGLGCVAVAYVALHFLTESFGRDLDFVES